MCKRAQRLDISTYDDDSTTFLLRSDAFYLHQALRPGAPAMALHVNGPIPMSLYFCFLSRMVVGSVEDLQG
jgi:hypothetical protein